MKQNYNPDVLSCLANLSNDEVFTPPTLANEILDILPAKLWSNPEARFLDPVCKSGVFLRETAKRLMNGLKDIIPAEQERANHIFRNQLFGIAITEITSFISRRSVYCSKTANGEFSVCTAFDNEQGNIYYDRMQHTWKNGKCQYCGANQEVYDRDEVLETHAYNFIHENNPFENMKFDVIIGNPPYQLTTGGSVESQATPIYNKFIEQAKKLNPRFLVMITPSRWLNGGFGLDNFRDEMLRDDRIRIIHDYFNASDCFPGVEIKGGVCYFLWDRDNKGLCSVYSHNNGLVTVSKRPLLEKGCDTFIRFSEGVSILHKVMNRKENSFSEFVSPRDPFGLNYYENGAEIMFKKFEKEPSASRVKIYSQGWIKDGIRYVEKQYITTRINLVDKFKVYISKAYGASEAFPHQILNKPFIGEPKTCCNMTYLTIGEFENEMNTNNCISYIQTKFFRFLVSLLKNTQNAYRKIYSFVPIQDFNEKWTDEKLYKKYGLSQEEIDFIESMIRPMELNNNEE